MKSIVSTSVSPLGKVWKNTWQAQSCSSHSQAFNRGHKLKHISTSQRIKSSSRFSKKKKKQCHWTHLYRLFFSFYYCLVIAALPCDSGTEVSWSLFWGRDGLAPLACWCIMGFGCTLDWDRSGFHSRRHLLWVWSFIFCTQRNRWDRNLRPLILKITFSDGMCVFMMWHLPSGSSMLDLVASKDQKTKHAWVIWDFWCNSEFIYTNKLQ